MAQHGVPGSVDRALAAGGEILKLCVESGGALSGGHGIGLEKQEYMPLMFIVILYNFSAGLTLYWTVQNMLSILQTKLTKNIVVEAPDVTKTKSALAKPAKPKTKRKK